MLCFFQYVGEGQIFVVYFGENEVGGVVDDVGYLLDVVGSQVFVQGFDDGDVIGYGCFEGYYDVFFLCCFEDFIVMFGDQGFVGCDYVFVVGDGFEYQVVGDVIVVDQFYDDIDFGIVYYQVVVIDDFDFVLGQFGCVGSIVSGDYGNFNVLVCMVCNFLLVVFENIESIGIYGVDVE